MLPTFADICVCSCPCGCADLCLNSDPLKCIVVDNVEHIAMNKEVEVLMKAPYHSGMIGLYAVEGAEIAADL